MIVVQQQYSDHSQVVIDLLMTFVNVISFEDAIFEKLLYSACSNLQNQLFHI